ncbi:hypothetical protein P8452_71157 [Trifolium repens]|nr:hypothetical protein P8452_71157 [Trifolium repens]
MVIIQPEPSTEFHLTFTLFKLHTPFFPFSNPRTQMYIQYYSWEFLRIKSWLLPTEHFMQPATARLASRSTRHGELACLRGPGGVLRHPARTCCGDLRHPARTCGALLMLAASLQQGQFCMNSLQRVVGERSWRAGFWADETRHGELLLATAS